MEQVRAPTNPLSIVVAWSMHRTIRSKRPCNKKRFLRIVSNHQRNQYHTLHMQKLWINNNRRSLVSHCFSLQGHKTSAKQFRRRILPYCQFKTYKLRTSYRYTKRYIYLRIPTVVCCTLCRLRFCMIARTVFAKKKISPLCSIVLVLTFLHG